MPDLAAVLKTEIARIARRSTSASVRALKKDVAALKRVLAQQKRLVARLQHDNARLVTDLNARLAVPVRASDEEVRHSHLSPRLVRAQRSRLGLSRDAFASLLGVSGGTVLAWEGGRSRPRAEAKAALVAVRRLGKREARERLTALAGANGTTKAEENGARKTPARPKSGVRLRSR